MYNDILKGILENALDTKAVIQTKQMNCKRYRTKNLALPFLPTYSLKDPGSTELHQN